MKCIKCNEKEANFHQRTNINGNISEIHLCSDCLEKNKDLVLNFSSNKIGKEFFNNNYFNRFFNIFDEDIFERNIPFLFEARPFFNLPATDKNFRRNATDEKTALDLAEKQKKIDERRERNRKITELQNRQIKMIETENYEEAAKIRDELKILYSQNNIGE